MTSAATVPSPNEACDSSPASSLDELDKTHTPLYSKNAIWQPPGKRCRRACKAHVLAKPTSATGPQEGSHHSAIHLSEKPTHRLIAETVLRVALSPIQFLFDYSAEHAPTDFIFNGFQLCTTQPSWMNPNIFLAKGPQLTKTREQGETKPRLGLIRPLR